MRLCRACSPCRRARVKHTDWLEDILMEIKNTLMSERLPPANESYDLNTYYYARAKVEAEHS